MKTKTLEKLLRKELTESFDRLYPIEAPGKAPAWERFEFSVENVTKSRKKLTLVITLAVGLAAVAGIVIGVRQALWDAGGHAASYSGSAISVSSDSEESSSEQTGSTSVD